MEEKRNDRPKKKNGTVSEKHAFKKPGGESSKDLTHDPITPKLME